MRDLCDCLVIVRDTSADSSVDLEVKAAHTSRPRAKKTCFGVHEEVCPAYHKTLHFVGASHKCVAYVL